MDALVTTSPRRYLRKGFTLIELLVVIAIIAILAAILFPVFARARENARRASCQSNLKQIALGAQQYSQDYDESLPTTRYVLGNEDGPKGAFHGSYASGTASGFVTGWPDLIQPYTKSAQVLYCPSDRWAKRYATASGVGNMGMISYGMNICLNQHAHTTAAGCQNIYQHNFDIPSQRAHGIKLAAVNRPASKIMFGDINRFSPQYAGFSMNVSWRDWGSGTLYAAAPDVEALTKTGTGVGDFHASYASSGYNENNYYFPGPRGRHFGGANIAYVDGHVKFVKNNTPGIAFVEDGAAADRLWAPGSDIGD